MILKTPNSQNPYEKIAPKRSVREVFRNLNEDTIIISILREYRGKMYRIKVGKIDENREQLVFDIISISPPIVRKQIAIDMKTASETLCVDKA